MQGAADEPELASPRAAPGSGVRVPVRRRQSGVGDAMSELERLRSGEDGGVAGRLPRAYEAGTIDLSICPAQKGRWSITIPSRNGCLTV